MAVEQFAAAEDGKVVVVARYWIERRYFLLALRDEDSRHVSSPFKDLDLGSFQLSTS